MIRLILILFFLALSRDLYAQIAVKVGINQASAFYPNLFKEGRTGFYTGLLRDFNLNDRFNLRGEFLYSQKGFRIEGFSPQFGLVKIKANHNYLDFVVALEYKLINNAYFQLGGILAALVEKNYYINNFTHADTDDFNNRLDFSPMGGIRYEFNSHLSGNLRFSHNTWSIDGWYAPDNVVLSLGFEYFL